MLLIYQTDRMWCPHCQHVVDTMSHVGDLDGPLDPIGHPLHIKRCQLRGVVIYGDRLEVLMQVPNDMGSVRHCWEITCAECWSDITPTCAREVWNRMVHHVPEGSLLSVETEHLPDLLREWHARSVPINEIRGWRPIVTPLLGKR